MAIVAVLLNQKGRAPKAPTQQIVSLAAHAHKMFNFMPGALPA
jgi:hypothetical protein